MEDVNQIIEILKSNSNWNRLMLEYEEPYILSYQYKNIIFWIFKEVSSKVYVAIAPNSIRRAWENKAASKIFAKTAIKFFESLREKTL